jgi:hypothetical protein
MPVLYLGRLFHVVTVTKTNGFHVLVYVNTPNILILISNPTSQTTNYTAYRKGMAKKKKKKVEFTLEQGMKAQRVVEVYLYSFFNLGARWGWVFNATPRPLYPRKRDPVPFYRRLSRSGRVRKILPTRGIRSPDRRACCKSLYQVRRPGPTCIQQMRPKI